MGPPSELLECTLCNDVCARPRIHAPCTFRACTACLVDLQASRNDTPLRCPVCRAEEWGWPAFPSATLLIDATECAAREGDAYEAWRARVARGLALEADARARVRAELRSGVSLTVARNRMAAFAAHASHSVVREIAELGLLSCETAMHREAENETLRQQAVAHQAVESERNALQVRLNALAGLAGEATRAAIRGAYAYLIHEAGSPPVPTTMTEWDATLVAVTMIRDRADHEFMRIRALHADHVRTVRRARRDADVAERGARTNERVRARVRAGEDSAAIARARATRAGLAENEIVGVLNAVVRTHPQGDFGEVTAIIRNLLIVDGTRDMTFQGVDDLILRAALVAFNRDRRGTSQLAAEIGAAYARYLEVA